jgi:flagellar motor switch protein FliG
MSEAKTPGGAHRVAAFLLSLEREAALEVMRHLDEDTVSDVAAAMTELGAEFSESANVDRLYSDLALAINTPAKITAPNSSQLHVLLEEAFGSERAAALIEQIRERHEHEQPFAAVEDHLPESIARALSEETPASAAIVLSHLDPGVSANVVSSFEPEFALAAVTKMATLAAPPIGTLKSIARNLEQRLVSIAQGPIAPDPSQRLKTIAEMLNFSGHELERNVLEGLERESEEMVAEIREFMFTWNDLASVDKRAMQKILASIDTRTLAIALKACAADVEDNISANLSTRVKAMVVEERELAGPVPMSEVLASRGELLKAVHALIDSGEFSPARGGEELVA